MRAARAVPFVLALVVAAARPVGHAQQAPAAPSFDTDVRPILDGVCTRCHNERKANAGLNLTTLLDPATFASHRNTWEDILDQVKHGDMPPPDEDPLSVSERAAMVSFIEAAFARADRELKPDPGHVPALPDARGRAPLRDPSHVRLFHGSGRPPGRRSGEKRRVPDRP